MRQKTRYLLVKLDAPAPFDERSAKHVFYNAVFELLGEAGAAEARVSLKEFDSKSQTAIVKCSLAGLDKVFAALALKRFEAGRGIALRMRKISGTISALTS